MAKMLIQARRRSTAVACTLLLALASFVFTEAARADIQVGSIASSRFGTSWTLDGSAMTVTRSKLLAAANFGGGGTVGEPIVITDTAATITGGLLSGFDVFFIGFLQDANVNAFSNAELAAFEAWVDGGGTLIVTCDDSGFDAVCAHFGHPVTTSSVNPHIPTAKGSNHPVFDGPFGVAASLTMTGAQGFFTDTTGATIMAVDSGGLPTVLFRHQGAGRVILYADVDMVSNFTLSAGTGIANDNDRFLANQFAFAGTAPAVVDSFNIRVGSIADSRFLTTYAFDGTSMSTTKDKLENPANFGRSGTVARTVVIDNTSATITEEKLAEHDVFFIGWLDDADVNAFTNAELFAFEAWVNGGGNMIVTCDDPLHDAVCEHFGHPVANTAVNPQVPTAAGAVHPIFDGPFGTAPSINMSGNQGFFTATAGADILAQDAGGQPTVLEKRLGAGRLILFADVDIIANFRISAGDGITSNNDIFLANLFAYAGRNRPVANDFNGDGHADILWRNTSDGKTVIHMFEDFGKTASGGIGSVPVAAWDMVGTGDFNRDGRADILWRNVVTGANILWLMNGFSRTAGSIGGVPIVWKIKGIVDFNDDGAADILWRNSSTGATIGWEMNGFTRKAAHGMGGVPLVWQIED